MNKKFRILVCGSTFGRYYLEAIKKNSHIFELVGILGTGSERSKICAKKYNTKLYTKIEDLPGEIDLACVVIRTEGAGGEGTKICMELMKKGIHCIQEQPVYSKTMIESHKFAKQHNVVFKTANFYAHLKETRNLIKCARYLNKKEKLLYIQIAFCTQVAFPVVNILQMALPSIRDIEVRHLESNLGPFQVMLGSIGSIPVNVQYNNQINPNDPDGSMQLLYKIAFVYSGGRLVLEDSFGPLIWNPRIYVPSNKYSNDQSVLAHKESMAQILDEYKEIPLEKVIENQWIEAIYLEIREMIDIIQNRKKVIKNTQKEILCAKQWDKLNNIFGFATFVNENNYKYFNGGELKKILKQE